MFGAGVAALALRDDDPHALGWAERLDAIGVEWFTFSGTRFETKPSVYGADGSNMESANCAELGLRRLLPFRQA